MGIHSLRGSRQHLLNVSYAGLFEVAIVELTKIRSSTRWPNPTGPPCSSTALHWRKACRASPTHAPSTRTVQEAQQRSSNGVRLRCQVD